MTDRCKQCGSYAINNHLHGRDGSNPDLCDVCYWRKIAQGVDELLEKQREACSYVLKRAFYDLPGEINIDSLVEIVRNARINK